MKHFFTFLTALFVVTTIVDAQSQFAVLDHEGNLTAYYGSSAFVTAYNTAVDGDIITLSPGNFDLTSNLTISKGITIRGAGAYYDSVAHTDPTRIGGSYVYLSANDSTHNLKIEGVHFSSSTYTRSLNYSRFNKCYFCRLQHDNYTMQNSFFINCYFEYLTVSSSWSNNQFINCIVRNQFSCTVTSPGNNTFANCYLYMTSNDLSYLSNLNIYNSIIYNYYNTSNYQRSFSAVGSTQSIYNSIGIWSNNDDFYYYGSRNFFTSNTDSHHLYNFTDAAGLFKSIPYYELTDSLANIYLGNDGTQIGPAGGNFPYNMSVHHPRLGNIVPALQTRPDGKLEVEVEIINE